MITRNRMKFLSPDDGSGAAVADPPVKAGPTTPGEYEAALAKEIGQAPSPALPPEAAPAKEPAPAKGDKPAAASKEEPVSALDAAMGDPVEAKKEEPEVDAETAKLLQELPETLPREGRGEHWARSRAAHEKQGRTIGQLNKSIADLTKQVETAKASPSTSTAELEALKTELNQYKDAVVAINVDFDPEHRKRFVDGRVTLVDKAASKLNAFGGKGETIKEALAMPEGRARNQLIKEAISELEPVEQTRVMQFVAEVEKLDDEKAEIMKDPQGAWDKLQKGQAALRQKESEQAEAYKKEVFENVGKKLKDSLFLMREVDPTLPGADKHNAGVKEIREGAFRLLGPDAKPEEIAEASYWRGAGPKLQELFVASRAELKQLRSQLKEYEESEPGFRGGKGPKKSDKDAQLEKSPEQIYNETMASLAGGEN